MSYILDALRRAEAERERGEVPGLQSQQHTVLDDDEAAPRSRPLVWVIVALAVALAAAIAWNFLGGEPPRSAPMAAAPAVAPVVAPPPPLAPAVASPVATPSPTSPMPAPPVTAAAPMPAAASATLSTLPPAVAVPPTVAEARRPPAARRVAAASAASPAASAGSPRAVADDRVFALSELPEPIRRELPKLAFGGSSYSGSATSRMVILNGQVFHEGDTVAPGLKLRQIKPKTAVLSFKDYRFELSY